MAHERSKSFRFDDKVYLLPTVVDGVHLSDEEVVRRFRQGRITPLGVFDSEEEADAASQTRSRDTDPKTLLRGPQTLQEAAGVNLPAVQRAFGGLPIETAEDP